MLPNTRLMARAFHRVPVKPTSNPSTALTTQSRRLSSTPSVHWDGRHASEHATREKDSHNVQQDAVKEGKKEQDKAREGKETPSKAVSQESGGKNEDAKKEFPEAPDTVGMVDERGGKD